MALPKKPGALCLGALKTERENGAVESSIEVLWGHYDLFDGLQTMMERAMSMSSYHEGYAMAVGSMRDDGYFDDLEQLRDELFR